MAPTRSPHVRLIPALIHSLLCCVIVMQMLGTPTSLWTLDCETDLAESSLLEELSLPPSHVSLSPVFVGQHYLESSTRISSVLLEETLFRPPSFTRSPMSLAWVWEGV